MTAACCRFHTNTCGHLDYCCDGCPTARESTPKLYATALGAVLLLVLFALGIS